jgi:DNA mismatch endonuclease, patch repair protein
MSLIRSKNTKPELIVRKIVHALGLRFRLHGSNLPGRPDLVLKRHQAVILVNGCFWHRHVCKFGRVVPKTRTDFWEAKRSANVARDRRNKRDLRRLGWTPITVWECETRDIERVQRKLRFFRPDRKS